MDISSFFSAIANTFRDRYLELSKASEQSYTPKYYELPEDETTENPAPSDSYIPSGEEPVNNDTTVEQSSNENPTTATEQPAGVDTDEQPDGDDLPVVDNNSAESTPSTDSSFYRRQARLDYKLDLRFDLATFTKTVERLSDGETVALEQIAAGGFGFSADFDIHGKQTVEQSIENQENQHPVHSLNRMMFQQKGIGHFQAHNRDFALDAFRREAVQIKNAFDHKTLNGYTRAVNKFSYRMHIDSQFSFGFAQRFNQQSIRMNNELPDQTSQYMDNAGELALNGSTEMMASFFDAVDAYLENAETSLKESVIAAFDKAAAELGFEGAMTDAARAQLTDSIEGFFDRVETALHTVESQYIPSAIETETTGLATDGIEPDAVDTKPSETEDPLQAVAV